MKLQIDTEEKTIKILQDEISIHGVYLYLNKLLGDELADYKLILNTTQHLTQQLNNNNTLPWVSPDRVINPGPIYSK